MNEMLAWLLDLNTLEWGAENVRFGFERPLPLWAWPGVALAAAVFALWSYRRLTGSRLMRGSLAVVRTLLLALLVVLISGPQLVQHDETVERDWLIVLVDRSASMGIADVEGGAGEAGRVSRESQLSAALQRSWPMWSGLSEQRTVVWLGFDAGAYDLPITEAVPGTGLGGAINLGDPSGRRTSVGAALDQGLRRAAARPLSSVVIISDGRSIDEPTRAAIRRLRAERIPVHVVPLGSPDPVGDLAVRRAEGPGVAFVGDIAPVTVDLERLGAAEGAGGVVRLTDGATGLLLDEQRVDPGAGDQTVTLTHRPTDAGASTWVVELVPDGPDLIAGNNRAEVSIELIDRPLRILYIDGYPRWEHRYLKNLLIREASIVSSNLLLAPNVRSSQEGDVELDALPDTPEGWRQFDVVVLGDVRPDVFTRRQLEQLREHVAVRGGGLLFIGGAGAMPEAWWGAALDDLLPFSRHSIVGAGPGWPALVAPTPLAERFGALRLGRSVEEPWPAELADPATGWSVLRWIQPIDPAGLKPTAEILALAVPVDPSLAAASAATPDGASAGEGGSPLIVSMRYGAGRVVYVATDEIWRWRYGRGEELFERFWVQIMRLLGRESLSRTGKSATLAVDPRRAVVDQPVRVAVELLDQSLLELGLASVTVRLARQPEPGETDDASTVELTLRPEGRDGRAFAATWLPTEPGRWIATTAESALSGLELSGEVAVSLPDDELRRPETDHSLLTRLSEETGGMVFQPDALESLPQELPNRRVRLVSETAEPLWDTPLALLLVIGLLTFEWVGRRLVRLI